MSREAPYANPYEPLDRTSDDKFVRRSKLTSHEESLKKQQAEAGSVDEGPDDAYDAEPINASRRNFVIGAATVAGYAALRSVPQSDIERPVPVPLDVPETVEIPATQENAETLVLRTPLEQMQELGRVEDLEEGIRAIYTKHHEYLTQNPNGRRDMEIATQNMSKLDMRKLVEPFKDRNIPQQFAYMIAIQETRGKNVTSWSGAKGITGLMPKMIKFFGGKAHAETRSPTDNPYVAGTLTADYIKAERARFGDNVDMLLHAYNGGAGLFGFTATTQKEERVPENFYAFMEQHINRRYREMLSRGYREHVIEKGDTLMQLSREYKVSLRALFKLNHMNDDSVLRIGDKVKVPFNNSKEEIKELFRKEFEVLHYAPEVRAKYEALKDIGLLARLEAHLPEKTSSFG
jgi:hypothetical protein